MPIMPRTTGALAASGTVRKCSSTTWNPARKSSNELRPMAIINARPMAESTEYRPPTQSQKPNMLAGSMPNAATPSRLVLTATKCRATASSPRARVSHARAVRALVSVSMVVNVFDETMKSVSAGSRPASARAMSAPSTLETKRVLISGWR
jgi:hypothetical protein